MTGPLDEAERLVRDFARRTNLQLAGRPFRISRPDAVGASLRGLLLALGCRDTAPGESPPGVLDFGVEITLDGAQLPDRGDASGRIDFAAAHMGAASEIASGLDLSGLSVGVAMMLEPKTANLALLLRSAGASVSVYAHPDETDPAVADALRDRGIAIDADASLSGAAEREAALAWLARGFDVVMDDGSHLIRLAHEAAPDQVERWIGACEETTSGLRPLRAMQAAGDLRTAIVAVNDAATKTSFDNRYGTGQSCVFAIADILDGAGITVRDQPALVIGYGPVGQGVAAHLRALGATVAVAERDPVRALLAIHDGYEVGPAHELSRGALAVSATGMPASITRCEWQNAVAAAVAGGVPGELDLDGAELTPVAPHLDRAADTLILDRGGCINITAAEGNPIEIMDLSFATQLAALGYLLETRPAVGVHELPVDAVNRVAQAALRSRGVEASPVSASGEDADWRSARYR
jgi:adenosylhomocysteinase